MSSDINNNHCPSTVKNRVLAQLSPEDFQALKPMLRPVEFKGRAVLQEANRPVECIHFIEDGLVSHVSGSRTDYVETAMVGVFGYVGVPLVLGASVASQRSIVSMPGTALRIEAEDLARVIASRPQIREQLLRYVPALIAQNTQSVLCAARHEINQRLARWLLLANDRIQSDVLYITHELLAASLGVRRASITNALLQFETEGIVQKTRGAVRVIDRPGLENRACDCYHIVRDAYAWTQITHDGHDHAKGSDACSHGHDGGVIAGTA
ncbi:cyclic nucleotide-binding domain (cNMP-BD) protein [Rhodopseudomonas palustris HaA2]|uniref:Cyclic nucleotide-binding domain (CNMP-BD) protein n=1 Tax=Rhodopseudomonas palustris (strain HaA2) TaxID=316058 RepID=Q2IX69_RHOP2|nr:Crp/Fnr family transcriptional regulator [Rhodopseudomonas palustris]ABD07191.1 cyclic nucleotide-binding domain (cNMP-BD) protein [Rhodopseudomonas palustris HaA2]